MNPTKALNEIVSYYEKMCPETVFTDFEKKVLREVLKVPLGKTVSYKDIARKIGRPRSSRAVARVLKKNPFFILIACHRVIQSDGKSGGYNRGRKIKKKLLLLEKQIYGILYK